VLAHSGDRSSEFVEAAWTSQELPKDQQLFALHGDIVHTIVMAIILLAIASTQRHQISAALGR
jgi:hypothetical protein